MVFGLTHYGRMLPEEDQRVKRRVLSVFDDFGATWGLWRVVGPGGRLSGRKLRGRDAGSVATEPGGSRCRVKARLRTSLPEGDS